MIVNVALQEQGRMTNVREYRRMLSIIRRDGFSLLTVLHFKFKEVEVISMGNRCW
jgi:hypothetical protein